MSVVWTQVGNGKLTVAEQMAHFALWAFMKAPLLIGADLRTAPAAVKQILQAVEVLAVNQDKLGVAADLVWKQGPNEVTFARSLRPPHPGMQPASHKHVRSAKCLATGARTLTPSFSSNRISSSIQLQT